MTRHHKAIALTRGVDGNPAVSLSFGNRRLARLNCWRLTLFTKIFTAPRHSISAQEHSIRTTLINSWVRDVSIGRDMWWTVVKEAATNWSNHKDARQGAALAYYSVFSLGPIIVIAIAVAGLLFGHDAVTAQVMSSISDMLGDTGAKAVEAMLAGASRPAAGILATILGAGALLFAAIGVVVQLKDALNVVWEVDEFQETPAFGTFPAITCCPLPRCWPSAFCCLFRCW